MNYKNLTIQEVTINFITWHFPFHVIKQNKKRKNYISSHFINRKCYNHKAILMTFYTSIFYFFLSKPTMMISIRHLLENYKHLLLFWVFINTYLFSLSSYLFIYLFLQFVGLTIVICRTYNLQRCVIHIFLYHKIIKLLRTLRLKIYKRQICYQNR